MFKRFKRVAGIVLNLALLSATLFMTYVMLGANNLNRGAWIGKLPANTFILLPLCLAFVVYFTREIFRKD